jgi:AraC-like DNA-binding protein
MQYLNHCRLEAVARRLQEQPGRSITNIALDCGFASSQYCATLFRRAYRLTPREFRRRSLVASDDRPG